MAADNWVTAESKYLNLFGGKMKKKITNRLAIVSITLFVIMLTFSVKIDAIEPGSAMAIWLLDEGDGDVSTIVLEMRTMVNCKVENGLMVLLALP